MINGRRIVIAGGAGSIGSELARQLAKKNKIFILDNNETGVFEICQELKDFWVKPRVGDIRDKATIRDLFTDFKPQIVVNAAALKHVYLSQIYPRDYVETNVIGNLNLIEEAGRWECLEKFVYISTDKIHSKSIMGATKKCGEAITTAMKNKYLAVRFGNVLGSRGSLLPIWEKQVNNGEPITITDEKMKRYFMTIQDACRLVVEAIEEGEGGEVIILDMGEPKKIIDLKKELYGDYPTEIIGIREGEVFEEKLMTDEEKKSAVKRNNFFIIKN
ncbi:MAG: polysaccharide biosynthesis protein [Patescibacteria group bacterium]